MFPGIFASAATRRSCLPTGDRDLNPRALVGGVLQSVDDVLDWLIAGPSNTPTDTPRVIPEPANTPTGTPKKTEADIELRVNYSPGPIDSQKVSLKYRFVDLQRRFSCVKLMMAFFYLLV